MSYIPIPIRVEGAEFYIGDFDHWTIQQAEHANRKYPGCAANKVGLNHLMRTWWLLEEDSPPHGKLRKLSWAEKAFRSKK